MELQCPQCGKAMQISAEEVALHGGAVVCPQCLAVFDAADMVPAGTVPERVPVRVIEEHLTYGFCPHCGRKIPQGVNFCPYCGRSLKQVEPAPAHEPAAAAVAPQPVSPPAPEAAPADKTLVEKSSQAQPKAWNPILPGYRYAKRNIGWRSGGQRAGVRFTVMALMVMAVELAVLAFIIYKISLLS